MNDGKPRVNFRRVGKKTGAVPEEWNGPQVGLSLHVEKDIGGRLYPVPLSGRGEVAIGQGASCMPCPAEIAKCNFNSGIRGMRWIGTGWLGATCRAPRLGSGGALSPARGTTGGRA